MESASQVKCPNCGTLVNVESIIAHRIEESLKSSYNKKFLELKKSMEEEIIAKEKNVLEKEKSLALEKKNIEESVAKKVAEMEAAKSKELTEKIYKEFEIQLKSGAAESAEQKKKIETLTQAAIENEKLKRRLDEQEKELEIKFEKQMTESLRQKSEEIARLEKEKHEMKDKEKDELIRGLNDKLKDMQRRMEQGSMQLQGEVQELALEELLKEIFVTDTIEEVSKGMKGADVIQTVRDRFGKECGKILYESKRTKHFNAEWVSKLKQDSVLAKADISVIVTETLPAEIEKVGQIEGVWICGFYEVKNVAMILRESLIRIHNAYSAQVNKGDKMQMLYDYLTGNEFRLQLGAIIEGFTALKTSYENEKRAMARLWKEREKQLERILLNTNEFIGSVQGIAGNSIPELKQIDGGNLLTSPEE